ncbi:hypothetical protein GE300_11765 [Rhodobacteraceae bacterium 2CG4]|uniref:Uncharacterized protein n=1 Tax=Halovulum marinum TaxID=2662447 RepID=A0A6L5Z1A7_9RHOB|nr:Gfo/Idh/MocA family oxidoreductase [Halovulum marinum]MSU90288.1 hypothetical protein [Halovulum marinum]
MTRSVLVCGYGSFGALHAEAWATLPGIRMLVADPDPGARARAEGAGLPGDRMFADPRTAMAHADLVDIATSPATHLPLALEALARRLPVLIEKPATPDVAGAETLLDAAHGLPLQIGLILRAHPLSLRARALIESGAIGRIVGIWGDFSGWKRMRADSSLLLNDGVHFLDLMRHLTGCPIVGVEAVAWARLSGAVADDIRIDTVHENGLAGELRLGLPRGGETADSVVPGAVTRKTLTVGGSEGVLTLDFNRNRLFHGRAGYTPCPAGWSVDPSALHWEATPDVSTISLLRDSFARFLNALDDGAPVLCDARQGALELARVCAAVETALAAPKRPFTLTTREPEDAA